MYSTVVAPAPHLRWVTDDNIVLQGGFLVDIPDHQVGDLDNTLEVLIKTLNLVLSSAPLVTSVFF